MAGNEKDVDTSDPDDSRWGLVIVLAFILGLPALGIILKMLGLY